MLSKTEKFKNWKIFCSERYLKNWLAVGTLARILTRWHVKMKSSHAFGTLARWQVGTWTTLARMARMAPDLANSKQKQWILKGIVIVNSVSFTKVNCVLSSKEIKWRHKITDSHGYEQSNCNFNQQKIYIWVIRS